MAKVTIDKAKSCDLKRDLRSSCKAYIKFWFISIVLNSIVGLSFYYIEHCYAPTPRALTRSELLFMETCYLANKTNETTVLKKNILLTCDLEIDRIESTRTRSCELTPLIYAEWFNFAYVTFVTIGYGSTVPLSDLGKIATIVLAVPLMVIAAATLIYAGDIIITITKLTMVKFERVILKRMKTEVCDKKIFFVQCVLTMLNWCSLALLYFVGNKTRYVSIIDAFYFVFITLTTIGFGDFSISSELKKDSPTVAIVMMIWYNFAMATIASLLTSASSVVKNLKLTKLKKIGLPVRRVQKKKVTYH